MQTPCFLGLKHINDLRYSIWKSNNVRVSIQMPNPACIYWKQCLEFHQNSKVASIFFKFYSNHQKHCKQCDDSQMFHIQTKPPKQKLFSRKKSFVIHRITGVILVIRYRNPVSNLQTINIRRIDNIFNLVGYLFVLLGRMLCLEQVFELFFMTWHNELNNVLRLLGDFYFYDKSNLSFTTFFCKFSCKFKT